MFSYDWTCEDGMGGGVITVIGSHIIDVVSAVIGQRAIRVHGITRTGSMNNGGLTIRRVTSDNFCTFQMEMTKGALGVITLNSQEGQQHFDISFTVSGTQGFVAYRSDQSGNSKK